MAKLTRVPAKVFAASAAATEIGQFGSAVAGSKLETADVATIQGLSAWLSGWSEALVSGNRYPALQEMNGLLKVLSYQGAYTLQEGIPEYDSATTYYIGSIVKKTGTFEIYGSLTDDNVGNALTVDTEWQFLCDLNLIGSIYSGTCSTAAYTTLTGTVSTTYNSTTVTGSGTSFTTQLSANDNILINNDVYTIASITNNTSLILSVVARATASSLTIQKAISEKNVIISNFTESDNTLFSVKFNNASQSNYSTLKINSGSTSYSIYDLKDNHVTNFSPAANEEVLFKLDVTNSKAYIITAPFWESRMSAPSNVYIDYSLTNDVNLSIIAPADGYATTYMNGTGSGQSVVMVFTGVENTTSMRLFNRNDATTAGQGIGVSVGLVRKGESISFYAKNGATKYGRFVYAEGSKP